MDGICGTGLYRIPQLVSLMLWHVSLGIQEVLVPPRIAAEMQAVKGSSGAHRRHWMRLRNGRMAGRSR